MPPACWARRPAVRQPEIPWCQADLSGNEARYLARAAAAGQVGPAGEFLSRFEDAIARAAGAPFAVAAASGTAALHVALILAGVQPGDEVLVPAWTFIATATAVRRAGAFPAAADAGPAAWQLGPARTEEFPGLACSRSGGQLTDTAAGRPVTAIVPVRLLGRPAGLGRLRGIAARQGLAVAEDAAQALGARYKGHRAGSGGLAALSFNLSKIITAGGGGAIVAGGPAVAARARYLISQARDGPAEYQHGEAGWNCRLPGLHAAVGTAQAERLDAVIAAKHRIRARCRGALGGLPGIAFRQAAPWASPTWWFTAIAISPRAGVTSRQARDALAAPGIQAGPPWMPLRLAGARCGCAPRPCPAAERLGRTAIRLPCSPALTTAGQDTVITALRGIAGTARAA